MEIFMNEDTFNMTVRKFLKEVGVTSQREIEKAVQKALDERQLTGTERLEMKVTLEVERIGMTHIVMGHVDLA